MRCPNCNKENPSSATVCSDCGRALTAASENVCSRCGNPAPSGRKLCPSCTQEMKSRWANKSGQPTPAPRPIPTPVPIPVQETPPVKPVEVSIPDSAPVPKPAEPPKPSPTPAPKPVELPKPALAPAPKPAEAPKPTPSPAPKPVEPPEPAPAPKSDNTRKPKSGWAMDDGKSQEDRPQNDPPPAQEPAPKKKNLLPVIIIAVAVLFLVLIIVIVLGAHSKPRPDRDPDESHQEQMDAVHQDDIPPQTDAFEIIIPNADPTETPAEAPTEAPTEPPTEASTEPDDEVRLQYFIENCDKMYLSESDLEGLDAEKSRIARNACYAKSGRKFKDKTLQEYFMQYNWYSPSIDPGSFSSSMLNDYQKSNITLVSRYESARGYK